MIACLYSSLTRACVLERSEMCIVSRYDEAFVAIEESSLATPARTGGMPERLVEKALCGAESTPRVCSGNVLHFSFVVVD